MATFATFATFGYKEFWPMGAMCRLCVHFEFFDWIL
jgi:hypothetical protein